MEFQSHSKHKYHFDFSFKQTCSEKNLRDSYEQVLEVLILLFW
jgi:hypothetical protein